MCGITGFFSEENEVDVRKYYDAHLKIAHRGPDDEGFMCKSYDGALKYLRGDDTVKELENKEHILHQDKSSLILGHRRLSIIDLSPQGHQPFFYENLNLVFNGEIYNYIELKEELILKGYRFSTQSDTEVFLKAFHCWGINAFDKFNGMWAAAIYDNDSEKLILTRDRFGIKPLYYSIINNSLIFGSEIKFVASFLEDNIINKNLVYSYLRYCHLEHTNETFIKDIYSLEEGTYLIYSNCSVEKKKYYSLFRKHRDKIDINDALNNSLNLRMRSDLEVGIQLSGGIDSSTIACKLHKEFNIHNLKTFTADFKEKKFSEREYVEDILEQTKFEGHFINIKADDVQKNMENLLYTQETPVRSMSVFLQNKIFEYIKHKTKVRVVLGGQGADEIFSGYTNDYYYYLISLLLEVKLSLFFREFMLIRKKLNISQLSLVEKIAKTFLQKYIARKDKYNIFTEKLDDFKYKRIHRNYFKDKLYKGLSFSALKEYLRDEDRNSMSFSIESRLPYLDYNLVEDAFSLEANRYIVNGNTKNELRNIAKSLVPSSISNRKDKMGFISPQEVWQKRELKDDFDKVFSIVREEGLFTFLNNQHIYELYKNYQKGKFKDWTLIWRIYCLYYYKKVWNIKE